MRISDWSSHVCSSDLPTTVTDALGRLTAQTTFDKSGRRHEVTDARGTVTRFGYDQRNRVVERRVDPARLNLTTLSAFDALGRLVAVTEGAGTSAQRVTTYGYDRKSRPRRSEERGEGKEWVSTGRTRGARDH